MYDLLFYLLYFPFKSSFLLQKQKIHKLEICGKAQRESTRHPK